MDLRLSPVIETDEGDYQDITAGSDIVCRVLSTDPNGSAFLQRDQEFAHTIVKAVNSYEAMKGVLAKLSRLAPSNEGLGGHAPIEAFLTLAIEARRALALADGKE